MQKLRVGVIGVGKMGRLHARAYDHFNHLCTFTGVYDPDEAAAGAVARKYEVTAFSSVSKLLDNVDAVTIAAPTDVHFELTTMALERGVHVLVEKPVCRTVEEARQLAEMAEQSGCTVQVGHIERFNPAVQELAKIIKDQKLIAIEVRRTAPYDPRVKDLDVIQDMMVHDIDIVRYLTGADVKELAAFGRRVKSESFVDHAVAVATLDDGVIVTFTASRVTEQKSRTMSVTCEDAFIEMDYIERRLLLTRDTRMLYENNGKEAAPKMENVGERIFVPDQEPLLAQTKHFLDCIRTGSRPLIGVSDGLAALEVVERIQAAVYKEKLPSMKYVAV